MVSNRSILGQYIILKQVSFGLMAIIHVQAWSISIDPYSIGHKCWNPLCLFGFTQNSKMLFQLQRQMYWLYMLWFVYKMLVHYPCYLQYQSIQPKRGHITHYTSYRPCHIMFCPSHLVPVGRIALLKGYTPLMLGYLCVY